MPEFTNLEYLKTGNDQKRYNSDFIIREIKPSEYPFLKEMLYQAIFIPQGQPPLPRPIVEKPELRKYYEDFGKPGDFCLVAEKHQQLMGAIWIRLFDAQNKSYGFVDAETPEVSMAVLPEYRNQGIGSRIMAILLERLKNGPYPQLSLSVDAINFAYNLYKKHGFVDQFTVEGSVTMVKKI
jgi:GNAT superfamily N-acetyltransferase